MSAPFQNPLRFSSPFRSGTFTPTGEPEGMPNPKVLWWGADTLAARLFVGFNVCQTPTYSMGDLVPIVKEIRQRQVGDPGASFISQRGVYRDQPPPGERDCGLVEEDSAQVVIFATSESYKEFRDHMLELAGEVARRLHQRSVILEFQKGGMTTEAMGVAA